MQYDDQLFDVINQQTGEIEHGVQRGRIFAFREKMQEEFFMVFQHQEVIDRLFGDPEMTAETIRVLFRLLFKMDYENWVIIHQANLARELSITPEGIGRIIKRLVDKGVLTKANDSDNPRKYKLDNRVAFKGRAGTLRKARKQEQEALHAP